MAKWAHANVLDSGPKYISGLAATPARIKQHLVKTYALGDSYATVVANSVGVHDLADTDFTYSSVGSHRKVTIAAQAGISATAGTGANPDNHIVIVDSTGSAVLLVTDETANDVLVLSQVFNFPAWSYTVNQPI
jgi:hypothetical protein